MVRYSFVPGEPRRYPAQSLAKDNAMLRKLVLLSALSMAAILCDRTHETWKWSERESSILTCLMRGSPKYDIALSRLAENNKDWKINAIISTAGKEVFKWDTHHEGVFAITNDVLIYSNHHPISTGCEILAVNLKNGKTLWNTPLAGVGPISHSIYRNRINLVVLDGKITVYGNESGGQYIEILDFETGAQVSHKLGTKKGNTF